MKFIISILLSACFYNTALSQTNNGALALDSLTLTTRNVQDGSDILPLAPADPNYVEPRVQVTMQFVVKQIELLKTIEIAFETEKSKKDFKVFKLDYTVANGKSYLTIKNKFYEIVNSKVTITEELPAQLLKKKIYFSVKGVDKNQNTSNVLTKEFN